MCPGHSLLSALALLGVLPFDAGARLAIFAGALGFVAYSVHLLLFGLFGSTIFHFGRASRLRQFGRAR